MKYFYSSLFLFFTLFSFSQSPVLVSDFNTGNVDSYNEFNFESIKIGDELIFPIVSVDLGEELAVLKDGELSLLKDLNTGTESSNPKCFVEFNDKVFFSAFDEVNGGALWSTDGTADGTNLFFDPGTDASNCPQGLIVSTSGDLYYTYGDVLFRTDGVENVKICDDVQFITAETQQSNNYCLYNDNVAFMTIANDSLRLFAVDQDDVRLLAQYGGTSSFTKYYGLNPVKNGLVFGMEDSFHQDVTGTYFYNESSDSLYSMTIDQQVTHARRLHSFTNDQSLAWVGGKGYYAVNGNNDDEELLFATSNTSFTQMEGVTNVVYNNNIAFCASEGFWGEDYLVFSDGSAEGSKKLFELNSYISNMIVADSMAYIASGTSNGFEPEMYAVNMNEGVSDTIYDFNMSSDQSNSVLLLGVLQDKLYFLSNLDTAVGRELYALELETETEPEVPEIPSSSNFLDAQYGFKVNFTSESFEVESEIDAPVHVKIYTTNGSLINAFDTEPNAPYTLNIIHQIVIIQFELNGIVKVHKYIGR